jgi:hypothetical protein
MITRIELTSLLSYREKSMTSYFCKRHIAPKSWKQNGGQNGVMNAFSPVLTAKVEV